MFAIPRFYNKQSMYQFITSLCDRFCHKALCKEVDFFVSQCKRLRTLISLFFNNVNLTPQIILNTAIKLTSRVIGYKKRVLPKYGV